MYPFMAQFQHCLESIFLAWHDNIKNHGCDELTAAFLRQDVTPLDAHAGVWFSREIIADQPQGDADLSPHRWGDQPVMKIA